LLKTDESSIRFQPLGTIPAARAVPGIPYIRADPADGSAFDGLSADRFILDSAAMAPKRNGGLSALPRPSPVICGYWTKAIALPRLPKQFHFRILASPRPLAGRNPLRRAPWRLAASHKRMNRHLAHRIEGCIAGESAVASCAF
jgi:hypothetical protein